MGDCFKTILLIVGILFGVMIAIGCLIEYSQYLKRKNEREKRAIEEQKRKEEQSRRENEWRLQKEKEENEKAEWRKENQLRIKRERIEKAEADYEEEIKKFERVKEKLFNGQKITIFSDGMVATVRDAEHHMISNRKIYDYLTMFICNMKKYAEICNKENEGILECISFSEKYKSFYEKVEIELRNTKMISLINYGTIDDNYYNRISSLSKICVEDKLSQYESCVKEQQWGEIWNIDPNELVDFVWFFAINKPFSANNFNKAKRIIEAFYIDCVIQLDIAEMFAINQMGAKNILRDKINAVLQKPGITSFELNQLASSLMCMKAYDEELLVLSHMASNSFQMSAKLQERLYMLSNGGGKLPVEYDVSSSGNDIYADISSLSWNEEEYKAFFDSLSFQDKSLSYSLVLRDSNKDLLLSKDFVIPKDDLVCKKISELFQEEYGNDVIAKKIHLNALSGEDVEKMDGILAKTNACKHLGVFVHIARIGKKLNIKFYTLYMPEKEQLSNQKQKAMSIYRKINPVVEMWETGMMETILLAIQRILNTSSAPTTDNGNNNTEVEF